ncbi:very short patch repair endonuclease [Corynebacterium sp. NPDC060344]|uniref:very short patch repair endonuclease n=1 Tax=Corynebacterium sp. NPDC060344 TaxID=3347101 RepID=UPI0036585F74
MCVKSRVPASSGGGTGTEVSGGGVVSAERRGPTPLNSQVSRNLSRVKRRDTKPEIQLRRELHRRGLRFRVDYGGVSGHPDVAFTRVKIAAFIDGCFWHGCSIHGSLPKNNAEWWRAKIQRNRERDAHVTAELRVMGWVVLRYWTHDDIDEVADEIEDTWRELAGLAVMPLDRE